MTSGATALSDSSPDTLSGTPSQVEWADRIKLQVKAEFDRVAASFRSVAMKQDNGKRAETESILAILEDKRSEVMSQENAGYFIRDWQDTDRSGAADDLQGCPISGDQGQGKQY